MKYCLLFALLVIWGCNDSPCTTTHPADFPNQHLTVGMTIDESYPNGSMHLFPDKEITTIQSLARFEYHHDNCGYLAYRLAILPHNHRADFKLDSLALVFTDQSGFKCGKFDITPTLVYNDTSITAEGKFPIDINIYAETYSFTIDANIGEKKAYESSQPKVNVESDKTETTDISL